MSLSSRIKSFSQSLFKTSKRKAMGGAIDIGITILIIFLFEFAIIPQFGELFGRLPYLGEAFSDIINQTMAGRFRVYGTLIFLSIIPFLDRKLVILLSFFLFFLPYITRLGFMPAWIRFSLLGGLLDIYSLIYMAEGIGMINMARNRKRGKAKAVGFGLLAFLTGVYYDFIWALIGPPLQIIANVLS